ncbi:tetratricopeptide repeat protein [Amphritea balenae]|uniref:Tetratricopeptide repeat protein n=1 Tax=Amphritea balenae TaxID=452629 RepID=A0A3P1SR43_9GAMM|nr:tetratricopeptide repeat protein [Amphritea balenae]RRC99628.1 hypothetical protein EHS89_09010 [Amphritea balenae]GGK78494.1 TPR repeat-containing protein [Amphritea balenae]
MKAPFIATIVTTALATALLSGCSSMQNQDTQTTSVIPLSNVEYQPGELNRETLYELIVAEMAGQRKNFDLSLENYLHQAQLTGDAAIAKRATHIAQYLQREDELLLASSLWQQAEPENSEPYQISASLLLRKGDFSAALPLLRKALKHSDKQSLLIINSQADQLSPEETQAYIQLLKEHKQQNNSAELQTTLGILYKNLGKPELAFDSFDQALALDKSHKAALFQKAELLRIQNKYKQAIRLIEPQLDSEQADQQLFTLYVQLLFQSDQIKKASQQAQLLNDSFPDEPQLSFYVALLLLENKQIDQSRAIMEDLLERYPNNSTPHYYLGLIEQREKNTELAIEHFLKVRDSNNIMQSFSRISSLLDHPDNQSRLQTIMQEGRSSLPEISIQLYVLEAEWLNLHDSKSSALSLLDEALQQHNNDINLLYTRAMTLDPQDISLIEKDLRQVLELEPDNSMALNALGYTLTIYTDRLDEAFDLISKAHQLNPQDPAILDSMGWILYKQGKARDSISFLKQAWDAFPDPEVSSHLIQAYHAAGQEQQALDLLQQELLKHPDNEFLIDAASAINAPR